MGGQFTRSDVVKFSFTNPTNYQTNVGGGQMTLTDETDATKIYVQISYEGTQLVNAALSELSGNFRYNRSGGLITIFVEPDAITSDGRYVATVFPVGSALTGHIPQLDYCDVGDSYGTLYENAQSAAALSDQAQDYSNTAQRLLNNPRFFQYLSGGSGAKARLWYRNDNNDAWLGYFPAYANTTTGGTFPPASILWATSLAEVTGLGAFVSNSAGPT